MKLSPRKTRTKTPSTSPKYFLVQLSCATAILSSSYNKVTRQTPVAHVPSLHLLWPSTHQKSPNLHAPTGAHRSGLFPSVSRRSLHPCHSTGERACQPRIGTRLDFRHTSIRPLETTSAPAARTSFA